MPVQIENPAAIELTPNAVAVLERIFARYKRLVIIKEFATGLSGSSVLEVRPIKADGTPELPTVVKVATASMIQQEWRAYQKHIHNRLPHIASVAARPTMLPNSGLGGLRYPLMGGGGIDIISLLDFCAQPEVSPETLQTLLERLLRIMENVWGYHRAEPAFSMQASYDRVLPPQLLLRPLPCSDEYRLQPISPRDGQQPTVQPGERVALYGFVVQKVDAERRTVTLRVPPARPGGVALSARLVLGPHDPLPDYRAQQQVDLPAAEVIDTRESRLRAEIAALGLGIDPLDAEVPLADGLLLPNPLLALPHLLDQTRPVNLATIHGDFNLQNILIEPQLGDINLIDFAEARHDHVLHDLLHLESEVITHLLPMVIERHKLDPVAVLVELGWGLHRAMTLPAHEQPAPEQPDLRKVWVMLRGLRRAARRYLFAADDPGEYYSGLILYLLGALRFRNLSERADHPLPKRVAFWTAALANVWLHHPDGRTPPAALAPLLARGRSRWAGGEEPPGVALVPPIRDGDALLALLPLKRVPPLGALPPRSRMTLERNRRFVGRQGELQQLAAALRGGETGAEQGIVAVTGLGGLGKTQLASEFVYRYGRFFAGGVFWISCAEPAAIAAEVAACGDQQALGLRSNFVDLPLEEQVRLVQEAWEQPIPRLLIFDSCETPELLRQWLPQKGGARVLLTSRSSAWREAGLPTLSLEVLCRADSLALLGGHQPDADSEQLDAIANELGDLPLALHLAGSYLARYRHVTNAAGYLASLREVSPLHHQSLQERVELPTYHDPHVARTFAVSYDQLAQDAPHVALARTLMHCAACLAPGELIPESLVRLALAVHQDAATMVRAEVELGEAVDYLLELGLMRFEANNALRMHRLVAEFTRERMGDRLVQTRAVVEQRLCAEAERLNARRDPAQLRGWQAHLRVITEAALPRADVDAADLAHALAEHLYQTGDYQGARSYHERALAIRRAKLGSNHPATARSLTQIGKVLLFYGDVAHARPFLEEALLIQRAQLGDHNDTATTLNHLGFLLQLEEEWDAARQRHEESLRIRRIVLGDKHPAVVDSLCNLAYVAFRKGAATESYRFLQQALTLQRRATGDGHPDTAHVLTNMGEFLVAQGQLAEAEGYLMEALAIQERELGGEHPGTARTLTSLGDLYRLKGDVVRARSSYERALRVFLMCHGADHHRTKKVAALLALVG